MLSETKQMVQNFWEDASCGEELYLSGITKQAYQEQSQTRYHLEPYIKDFAEFENFSGKKVLEIGVGLGADHQKFAECGAKLVGIDLTARAINHTQHRFQRFGLTSLLQVADAEHLPFDDEEFALVYSWGVLHHSPHTEQAIHEVWRVIKPGGVTKIMIYHTWSFVGFMLWIRYALLKVKPFTPLRDIYSQYLESPGTKAYTVEEAYALFSKFDSVKISTVLTHGDLLTSSAGQRHQGLLLSLARKLWPRWFIRSFFPNCGLFMLITARKPLPT